MKAAKGLVFPIRLKTDTAAAPPGNLYYEVAANGIFQVRDTKTHRAVTRAEHDVPGLQAAEETIELRFPRIPRALAEDVLAFFYEVHHRWMGEAIVILFYDPERETFEIGVPPQTIAAYTDSAGRSITDHHLEYGEVARPPGFLRLGTIHSHGSLPAYASHTDCEDERYEDGLHVVFGHLTASQISRSAAFVASGRRFPLDPDEVLEPAEIPAREAPEAWLAQVEFVESAWGSTTAAEVTALYYADSACVGTAYTHTSSEDEHEH